MACVTHWIREYVVGDYARLIFVLDGDKKERMWVKVTDNSFPFFEGVLDNDSYYLPALIVGEPISFEAQHIADPLIRKDN